MSENDYNTSLKQRCVGTVASDRDPGENGLFLGHAETHAKSETEREIAARLAMLELFDPSQRRPARGHR